MIKFNVEAQALHRALNLAGVVPPTSEDNKPAGYLFVVSGETCSIFSRDSKAKHEARTSFHISEAEGEGRFMLPSEAVSALKLIKEDQTIQFEASSEDDVFRIRYSFGSSGSSEKVSFDPRAFGSFEKDITKALEEPEKEFPVKALQIALGTTKTWLPKPTDKIEQPHLRTIKIFGQSDDPAVAKGDGFMFATNGQVACFYRCTAFLGKELLVPEQHLRLIESFLSRSEGRAVKIYSLPNKSYMVNESGDIVGWNTISADHKKFSYLSKNDEIVLMVTPKDIIDQLKFVKADMASDKFKVRMAYDPTKHSLQFSHVDGNLSGSSLPVSCELIKQTLETEEQILMSIHVDFMLKLFEGLKGNSVEFRVKIIPASSGYPRPRYLFRTIDQYSLTTEGQVVATIEGEETLTECQVTRLAPGID